MPPSTPASTPASTPTQVALLQHPQQPWGDFQLYYLSVLGFRGHFGQGSWGLVTRVLRLPSSSLHSNHMLSPGLSDLHLLGLPYWYLNSFSMAHSTVHPTAHRMVHPGGPSTPKLISMHTNVGNTDSHNWTHSKSYDMV